MVLNMRMAAGELDKIQNKKNIQYKSPDIVADWNG